MVDRNDDIMDTQSIKRVVQSAPIDVDLSDDEPTSVTLEDDGGLTVGGTKISKYWVIFVLVLIITGAIICTAFATSSRPKEPTVSQSTTSVTTPAKPRVTNGNVDLTGIVDQKWSNAKKILRARGAGLDAIVTLTDDGKEPIIDSNWTVKEVSRGSDGIITVKLHHDQSDVTDDIGGAAGKVKDKAGQAWSNLSDGSMGLGKHPNGD